MIAFPPAIQEPAPEPDAGQMLEEARALRAQGKRAEAVAIYTRMLEIWEDHRLALTDRAQTLAWMKRFDEAIRDYRRALAKYPDQADEVEPALARVLAWSKRFREGVQLLESRVARGDRAATLDTATFLSWDHQFTRSLNLAAAWLKEHPGDRDFLVLQGRVLGWSGRHQEARQAYDTVLKAAPEDKEARLGLAQLDLWAGNPEGAAARMVSLTAEDATSAEAELMRSQIAQRQGRLREARARAEALRDNPEVQEDVQSRLRDLAEAQGPWVELAQTRTDSNDGLRAEAQHLEAALPLLDGSLRLGGTLNQLEQAGQSERRPKEWTLGLQQPLGARFSAAAQVGRVDEVGGSAATSHALSLGWRPAPGLNLSLSQSFQPNLATPRAVDLRTDLRTWGLGGGWVFNHTLDQVGLSVERTFLSAGAMKTAWSASGGHRFPFEGGEWRGGLAARRFDQNLSLDLGFFNPQRYRYYGATAGLTLRREERWECTLDGWGGQQAVNEAATQFGWGYTLAGTWSFPRTPLSLFAAWSQSVAGLPVSASSDPSAYRDHTLRVGLRIRGQHWIW
jgi:tetratricopeptide (TPR) repeat protein